MKKFFINKKSFILILCLIVGAMSSPLISKSLQLIGDVVSDPYNDNSIKKIILCIIIILSIILIDGLINIYKSRFEINSANQLRKDVFFNLLNKPLKEFIKKDSAEYYNLILRKIDVWREMYIRNILIIIQNSLEIIFVLFFVLRISPIAFITIIVSLIPLTINNIVFPKKIDKSYDKFIKNENKMISKLKEYLLGFEVIKFNNSENIFSDKMNLFFDKTNKSFQKIWLLNNISGIIAFLGQVFSQISGILIGAYLLINNFITLGEFLVLFKLSNDINEPIIRLINGTVGIQSVRHVVNDLKQNISEQNINLKNNKIESPIYKIELKNFSFKYPNSDNYLLKNVSFLFEKNKKYLILGESGSGKSTLIKILMKEIDSYEGQILINDIDIKDISYKELFSKFSYASQKTYIFDMSVKDNIDLNSNHTEKEINNLIENLCLNNFISNHKDGINTIINEEVNKISGGEKSKINLCRALISNKDVLIVDESLSPIDIDASNIIEESLLNINKNNILLHIAHKSNKDFYHLYDSVIELKSNTIIEKLI